MLEVVSEWTGFVGAPGSTVMYFDDSTTSPNQKVRDFFTAVADVLPDDVSITVPDTGREIDPTDGSLTGTWSGGSTVPIAGTGLGAYAAPSGAIIRWNTTGTVGNRFVRGRTFLVPIIGTAYEGDGSLTTGTIQDLQAAGDAMVTGLDPNFGVWSRPLFDRTDPDNPVLVRPGSFHGATTATAPDFTAVLTSRRD